MNMQKNLISQILILISFLMLGACASNHKPPKESDESGEKINVQIIVAPDVNPDMVGRPSPVRLDLYQLTSDGEFKQSNYFDLINETKEKLGDKLIQHNQYMLHPDTVKVFPVKVDSHLKYFGVVVSYRDLNESQWRLMLLKQDKRWYQFGRQYLYLNIGKNTVSQLSKQEMREMLKEYKERHPEQKNIRESGKARKEANDLSKGIFREDK